MLILGYLIPSLLYVHKLSPSYINNFVLASVIVMSNANLLVFYILSNTFYNDNIKRRARITGDCEHPARIMEAMRSKVFVGDASQFLAGAALFSSLGLNSKLGIILLGIVVILYCGFSGMWWYGRLHAVCRNAFWRVFLHHYNSYEGGI